VPIQGADADLDQSVGEAALHDPGERRSVAQQISAEVLVEVRVRVEMQDVERTVDLGEPGDDRECDHMIAAEKDRNRSVLHCGARGGGNLSGIVRALVEREVAGILDKHVGPKLETAFAGHVGVIGREGGADRGRRGRGPAKV